MGLNLNNLKKHFRDNQGNLNINWVLEDIGELLLIFLGVKNGIMVMLKNVRYSMYQENNRICRYSSNYFSLLKG